ncbi:MAG: methyltransferase domain-containing protein [Chloroflexi bacterium]|nr:methyltransferase domain-containing protein [Chloroflexota bacterium]
MALTIAQWHRRFQQQAGWTRQLREKLFAQADLNSAQRILEIGSGTSAVLSNTIAEWDVYGIDIDLSRLQFANQLSKNNFSLVNGDGHQLPFDSGAFAAAFCHYLLLWVTSPNIVLKEMVRVTRTNGAVIAFAEPDYGGRIDYPDELAHLGALQARALTTQGADIHMGRKLASLFSNNGLINIQTGVLQGHWSQTPAKDTLNMEWDILKDDLEDHIDPESLDDFYKMDLAAWQTGQRVQFIPTFYALGLVK